MLPELPDVLVASIYTIINGAYVYPKFAFAHELLGAGAIGFCCLRSLSRGRWQWALHLERAACRED